MRGAHLAALGGGLPAGVPDALEVVAGVDEALTGGLARLGEADAAALGALAGALAGTPLGGRTAEAVAKVAAGAVSEEYVAVLAGARSALLGAVHDALLGQLDAALTRDRHAPYGGHPSARSGAQPVAESGAQPVAAARAWLHEVAVTGWRGVDHDLVAAAGAPVESAWATPGLRRLAVLLDGFAAELRAAVPVATLPQVPARRWADLWARGMLLTHGLTDIDAEPVSGRLLPLGVDVHEHDTAVQVQAHAVLEPADGGPPRLVRTAVGAAKVDTIGGPALWRLLDAYPVLRAALAQRRALEVTDVPLRGGDLTWHDDRAQLGGAADPFATARVLLPSAVASSAAPLHRHPVGIAEPVLVEGYAVRDEDGALVLEVDGVPLAVDVERLPSCGPLTRDLVVGSSACLGLVRWDAGRWSVQPLAVQATVKRKPLAVHTGDWACGVTDAKVAKAEARAGDAVTVLRERAGRLLRS